MMMMMTTPNRPPESSHSQTSSIGNDIRLRDINAEMTINTDEALPNGILASTGSVVSVQSDSPISFSAATWKKYLFPSVSFDTLALSVFPSTSSAWTYAVRVASRFSTLYLVTGDPPSDSGASQATIANSFDVSTTRRFRGADGLSAMWPHKKNTQHRINFEMRVKVTTNLRPQPHLRWRTRRWLSPCFG